VRPETAARPTATGPMTSAAASPTRTFTSPSGRAWTAAIFRLPPSAEAAGDAAREAETAVLRFRSSDVVLDLTDFPADWASLPDAALVALARQGAPPRFVPPREDPAARAAREVRTAVRDAVRDAGEVAFADRLAVAFLVLQVRRDATAPDAAPRAEAPASRAERVTPGAFAELVSARLAAAGTPRTVSSDEVVTWFADALPDLRTTAAIAEVCGVDPGWLAFGPASAAPSPGAPAGRGGTGGAAAKRRSGTAA
jgi:hypothetical protein